MTTKRFDSVYYEDFCRVITDNGKEINPLQVVELLNELHEENQEIKDILNELNSIENFWDSSLLQKYISKIANVLGVDLK